MATEVQSTTEKLPTLYGTEVTGKPFRILGDSWDRYKSSFKHKEDGKFGMLTDPMQPVNAPGNLKFYNDETKAYDIEARYEDYDFWVVTVNGVEYKGFLADYALPPWQNGNFYLATTEGKKTVDYDDVKDHAEHVQKLRLVHYLPVSFLAEVEVKNKTVKRAKLELTQTGKDALDRIVGALTKADADPKNYVFALTYVEAERKYVINDEDYRKLTDDERAAAAEEDENAKTTALDALPPPADEDFISDLPF